LGRGGPCGAVNITYLDGNGCINLRLFNICSIPNCRLILSKKDGGRLLASRGYIAKLINHTSVGVGVLDGDVTTTAASIAAN